MFWQMIPRVTAHFITFSIFVTFMTWVLIGVGAAGTFLKQTNEQTPKTFRNFLRYCFPPAMFATRSCRNDILFYLVYRFGIVFLIAPFLIGSVAVATYSYEKLTALMGPRAQDPESLAVWACVVFVVVIATDFATFFTHYLEHKFRVLWEFHKVHHSSEFLIPLTNRRFHPVQQLFDTTGEMLTAGVILAGISYAFSLPIYENAIAGVDAYYLLNAFSFHHLRHSHIYLSYGRLEKWILSPAQHHLHHSQEGRHWDKNFGLFLAVWDRLFGTLLPAEPPETYRLGLPKGECEDFQTVLQLYTTPFVNVWAMARNKWRVDVSLASAKPPVPSDPYSEAT